MEEQLSQTKYELQGQLQESESTLKQLRDLATELQDTVDTQPLKLEKLKSELHKANLKVGETNNKLAEAEESIEELTAQAKQFQRKSAQLEEALGQERILRREEAEEAQASLEKTRDVLETNSKKQLSELQANMNGLLDDERRAKLAKEQEFEDCEAEWSQQYKELQERSTSAIQSSREEAQKHLDFVKVEYQQNLSELVEEHNTKLDNVKAEYDQSLGELKEEHNAQIAQLHNDHSDDKHRLMNKGKSAWAKAKRGATELLQSSEDECRELADLSEKLQHDKDELEKNLRGKIMALGQQLEAAKQQIMERCNEVDDQLDKIKCLEREKHKLAEEIDHYHRHMDGTHGSVEQVNEQMEEQMEKLQAEFQAVVAENRQYQKQISQDASMEAIHEEDDENSRSPDSSSFNRQALKQIRVEHEAQIAKLVDQRRDLVMKNLSFATNLHRAENRIQEREEEIAELNSEITSLKLKIHRLELVADTAMNNNSSRSSTPNENHSPARRTASSSPNIDRAEKQKAAQKHPTDWIAECRYPTAPSTSKESTAVVSRSLSIESKLNEYYRCSATFHCQVYNLGRCFG